MSIFSRIGGVVTEHQYGFVRDGNVVQPWAVPTVVGAGLIVVPSAALSTAVINEDELDSNGTDEATVTITLRDTNNNIIRDPTVEDGLTITANNTLVTIGDLTQLANGLWTATITAGTNTGTTDLTVEIGGEEIDEIEVTLAAPILHVDYLIVGGGGGGGASYGGGGGGGGVRSFQNIALDGMNYPVVVGAGGPGGDAAGFSGSNGGVSSFNGDVALGGGGGGAGRTAGGGNGFAGNAGGSGGGGGAGRNRNTAFALGGVGTQGQGQAGGIGGNFGMDGERAGGGGGARHAGGRPFDFNGGNSNGGDGVGWLSGATTLYGAGGGGHRLFTGGSGGAGGGGAAGNGLRVAGNPGTGAGAGGGGGGQGAAGGAGGDGIVIVRYLSTTAQGTGGAISTLGDYTYHVFTANGTFTRTGGTPAPTGNITPHSELAINGQDNILGPVRASELGVPVGGTLEVPAGFWIWSEDASFPALILDVEDMTLINNGNIIGKGGHGQTNRTRADDPTRVGGDGGDAIQVAATGITITNNAGAFIAGGGGGGGGRLPDGDPGGGGAGGGDGGYNYQFNRNPGLGGDLNMAGTQGVTGGGGGGPGGTAGGAGGYHGGGGGGGRVLPGAQSAGGGANAPGGGPNQVGGGTTRAAGGGGWGAAGGAGTRGGTAGAAGAAIIGTARTLNNNGNIYGAT